MYTVVYEFLPLPFAVCCFVSHVDLPYMCLTMKISSLPRIWTRFPKVQFFCTCSKCDRIVYVCICVFYNIVYASDVVFPLTLYLPPFCNKNDFIENFVLLSSYTRIGSNQTLLQPQMLFVNIINSRVENMCFGE